MKSMVGFCVALSGFLMVAQTTTGEGKEKPATYLKAEVKGVLSADLFRRADLLYISINGAAVWLDVSGEEAIKKRAAALVKKTVVAKGRMEFRRLPEYLKDTGSGHPQLSEHPQPVIVVESIEEAK